MSMRLIASALPFCILAACSNSGNGGGGDAQGVADAPPLTGDMYSLTWGPVTVAAGVESTQCVWLRLGNDAEIKVHQVHNTLSASSHHLIVYKDDMDTTEQTTPMPCQPFTGALNTTGMIQPLIITQKKDDELTLPGGVAYTFAPHQMVKLEMHYINTTDVDQMASAQVNVFSADPAGIHDEAAVLFNGSPDIGTPGTSIPAGAVPGSTGTVLHEFMTIPDYLDLSASHIFAITGHTHRHGIDMEVNTAPSKGGALTPVYKPNPFNWAEPETTIQVTPFSVPKGGGFDFTCAYDNTGGAAVKFGESANDEMCFFWAYYYPAIVDSTIHSGSRVCIHTDQYGGTNGIDACCPGDPTICALVTSKF